MIVDIFRELFGEDVWDDFYDKFAKLSEKVEKEQKENKDDEESYFHEVSDTYEDGNHTSHVEKEVKNGKVLKDVNETYKIEDKSKCCKKEKCHHEKIDTNEVYEQKLREANDLLSEAHETIKDQKMTIETLMEENARLSNKFKVMKDFFDK